MKTTKIEINHRISKKNNLKKITAKISQLELSIKWLYNDLKELIKGRYYKNPNGRDICSFCNEIQKKLVYLEQLYIYKNVIEEGRGNE